MNLKDLTPVADLEILYGGTGHYIINKLKNVENIYRRFDYAPMTFTTFIAIKKRLAISIGFYLSWNIVERVEKIFVRYQMRARK